MRNGLQTTQHGVSPGVDSKIKLEVLKRNPLLEGSQVAFLDYLNIYGNNVGLSPVLISSGVNAARCIINAYFGKFEARSEIGNKHERLDTSALTQDVINTDIFAAENIIALLGDKENVRSYWVYHYLTKLALPYSGDFVAALHSVEHVEPIEWVRIVFNHLQSHAREAIEAVKNDGDIPILLPPNLKGKNLGVCTSPGFADAIVEMSLAIVEVSEQLSVMVGTTFLNKGYVQKTRFLSLMSALLADIAKHGHIRAHDNAESLFRVKTISAHLLSCRTELFDASLFTSFDYKRLEELVIDGCSSMLGEDASSLFQ